jgi:ribose 5-phosphate isomerase A
MAQQFHCFEDDCEFSEWAETEDEVLDAAQDHLAEHDLSVSDEEIRKHIRTIPSPKRIKSSPEEILDERREQGGRQAAEVVEDGMVVGLGTGSTTAWAITELGVRVEDGLDIHGVATSIQSHELAKEAGVPLINLDEVTEIDVAIDGADRYSPADPHIVKGGGASHAREKVIDTAADRLVIATDEEKATDPIEYPVPLSVLPDSRTLAMKWVREQGGSPEIRYAERKDGPLFTANGNLVIDCDFGPIEDPADRARKLSAIPGSQEHGLFVDMVDDLYIGTSDGVETIQF